MAALAYLLPPVSGFLAFLWGRDHRMRFHGLQSVALGAVVPAGLYVASAISADVTRVVWAIAALAWLLVLTTAAVGRDVRLPLIGRAAARLAG